MELIYKICPASEWYAAVAARVYLGSAHDRRDGFIHFSTAAQLAETAEKHFSGLSDLVLLSVEPSRLGAALRHEPSRGGALFPHLYGPLDCDAVVAVLPIARDDDGALVLPRDLR